MQAIALRTSKKISGKECLLSQKFSVGKTVPKAKRVRFFVNGDRFCKGNTS